MAPPFEKLICPCSGNPCPDALRCLAKRLLEVGLTRDEVNSDLAVMNVFLGAPHAWKPEDDQDVFFSIVLPSGAKVQVVGTADGALLLPKIDLQAVGRF